MNKGLNSGRSGAEFGAALLAFNQEVVVYCEGISERVAREYAIDYARMLQNRAKGVEADRPRIPAGLFGPDRNLIRSTLEKMVRKFSLRPKRGTQRAQPLRSGL